MEGAVLGLKEGATCGDEMPLEIQTLFRRRIHKKKHMSMIFGLFTVCLPFVPFVYCLFTVSSPFVHRLFAVCLPWLFAMVVAIDVMIRYS